jgi:phenylalanine-4-hydroxylase
LIGHGISHHADGFGSPVGKLRGINLPIEDMSPRDLKAYGIYEGETMRLEFESGVIVKGRAITGTRDLRGKILIITLDECTVTYKDQVLFQPEWGIYDMAIGKELISAYAGPADALSFENLGKVSETKTHKIRYSEKELALYDLYTKVRHHRENDSITSEDILRIFNRLKAEFNRDWLLPLELYEIAVMKEFDIQDDLLLYLEALKKHEAFEKLIENGLEIIRKSELQNI